MRRERTPPDEDMVAWDDMKQRTLDAKQVRQARQTEMQYVRKHQVNEYAPVSESFEKTGSGPIGTKWLDTNKGDDSNPCYRSRWVAQQFKRAWIKSVFFGDPELGGGAPIIGRCCCPTTGRKGFNDSSG